jgi:hypothetical protein
MTDPAARSLRFWVAARRATLGCLARNWCDDSELSSPFPRVAEHAFLSNCHTGAVVAPDASIDWLCVPSFDSPACWAVCWIGATVLPRRALRDQRCRHTATPTLRRACWLKPGTPHRGWAAIRDALTMSARTSPNETTPHTAPPSDEADPADLSHSEAQACGSNLLGRPWWWTGRHRHSR